MPTLKQPTKKRTRERQIYRETYHRHLMCIVDDKLPVLPHVSPGTTVVEAQILAAGQVERENDEVLEYQDLRVYLKPR